MIRTNKSYGKRFYQQRYIQVFALSGMLFLFIFSILPMIGLLMAFKDFKIETGFAGIFTSKWVGLKYFKEFFHEQNFYDLLRNTICISVLKLLFIFPMPIIFAILLNEMHNKTIKKIVQTASYLPYFISWVIVSGFCMLFFNTQTGMINNLLLSMGAIKKPLNILANPDCYWMLAVTTAVWKETGWWTILFLAAIAGIDPNLYEAATVEGASRLQKIRYITLPGIMPTLMVVLILSIGNLFSGGLGGSNFEQSYLLGNVANRETSDIIQTYVYRIGLAQGRYAYATAVGIIQSVISVVLIFLSNKLSQKTTGMGLY